MAPKLLKTAALALLALSVGVGEARGDARVRALSANPVKLRLRFDAPGCYPSGSTALTSTGAAITFTRASTKECGTPTCQVNEACVTASGLSYGTGEVLTVPTGIKTAVDWCRVVTATPDTWNPVGWRVAWSTNAFGLANSAALYVLNGTMYFLVWDGAAASRSVSVATGAWSGSHRIAACLGAGGDLGIYVDGVRVNGAASGTGTAIPASASTSVYIGAHSGSPDRVWIGTLSDLKECRGSSASRCP